MLGLACLVLLAVLVLTEAYDLLRRHASRTDWDLERRQRQARLMHEVRRYEAEEVPHANGATTHHPQAR
jgi:hypothetical protein